MSKHIGIFGGLVAVALAGLAAPAPSLAQNLSARERARLEGDVAAGTSISRDLQDRAEALDRAYRAARAIDRVADGVVSRVPGGRFAYRGGRVVGRVIDAETERRR